MRRLHAVARGPEAVRGIEGEQVLLRVILSESRLLDHRPIFRHLVELLRAEGIAGATVHRGQAGYGHDRRMHDVAIEVAASGLPIIVEVVDTAEHLERVLPRIEALTAGGGVIMLERAQVLRYAKTPDPPR
jgi:PII-like signaling protein